MVLLLRSGRRRGLGQSFGNRIRNLLLIIAMAAPAARAQLDLGSGDIPQDRIDGYMAPFYKVIASGIGAGRFFPLASQTALSEPTAGESNQVCPGVGFEVGGQADFVPLPDEKPFESVKLWAMPFFRSRVGLSWNGVQLMARGLLWKDSRIGDLTTFGAGLAYVRTWPGLAVPLATTLMAGWDVLDFTSTYTYKYRGSILGLFDQNIPGDYSLLEHVYAGGLMASTGHGPWEAFFQTWLEGDSGHFSYLYLDPRDSKTHEVRSNLLLPGARLAVGIGGYGVRLEAGWRSYPYFEAGWTYSR